MKLFIYEHITSGALIDKSLPQSLAREGNDMLVAIVQDFAQLADIELILLRDNRLEALPQLNTHTHCYNINNQASFQHYYAVAINESDAVLAIAPETDNILSQIQHNILNNQKKLLGCSPAATQICSDKTRYSQHLEPLNLLSPKTILASYWFTTPFSSPSGFIVKPCDGAGCVDTFYFVDNASLETWLQRHSKELNGYLIQAYIEGITISLSLLADHTNMHVLSINQQHIHKDNGKISFHGCTVNGIDNSTFTFANAANIAQKIHRAICGLWGFIGVDIILHHDDIFIIDINPRLTTSYIGLRQSLNSNPAQLLLTMLEYGLSSLPKLTQRHPIEVHV